MRSMTGFGRAARVAQDVLVAVEVMSVNHRFCEVTVRLPQTLSRLELELRQMVAASVLRGKVGVTVMLDGGNVRRSRLDLKAVSAYLQEARRAAAELGVVDDLALSHLLALPEVWREEENEELVGEVAQATRETVQEAIDRMLAMRAQEGARLKKDIAERMDRIEAVVKQCSELAPQLHDALEKRLRERIAALLSDSSVMEERIISEVAIAAEKLDVAEEITRLRSHARQFRRTMESDGALGRKLDFLAQEMYREANTMGVKARDGRMAHLVVEIKAELEKVREQLQNVE